MKTLIALTLLLAAPILRAAEQPETLCSELSDAEILTVQTIPVKPIQPETKFGKVDFVLGGATIAARVMDYVSTEQGLRTVGLTSHWSEKELPDAIAHNKASFAAFSGGMAAVQIVGQYELTKHGHRRMARTLSFVSIGTTGLTVANNYRTIDGVRSH